MSAPTAPKPMRTVLDSVRYAVLAALAAVGMLTLAVATGVIAWAVAKVLTWVC